MKLILILLILFACFCELCKAAGVDSTCNGLIGRWEFNDSTCRDLSGNGADAQLNGTHIYSLGKGNSCLMLMPETGPVTIPVHAKSPLAITQGTICFWLNVGWTHSNFLSFNNGAVQLNIYRGDFQVRFKGENEFNYGSGILDYNWPRYDMREWAFYGHPKAAVHDSRWHHFAVSYNAEEKRIVGWRDGELIAVVDLSKVDAEPLRREGLSQIIIGKGFAGFMDDLRIYDKALSDNTIRGIYNSAKSVFENRFDTNPTERTQTVYKYQKKDHSLYNAWLQYSPVSGSKVEVMLKTIVAESTNSTVQTAASELKRATKSIFGYSPDISSSQVEESRVIIGTAQTSPWIKQHAEKLGLERIRDDGYIIMTFHEGNNKVLVIAGRIPAGVIYGTFDLIRRMQIEQNIFNLDLIENPKIPIRMIDHWSYFRGFSGDRWRGGGRDNSIYSWAELAEGDTKLITDWVRMMASAGWNAICPSEVNWNYRDNFLDHLDQVETLAGILRNYGMKLYWSPSYLIALDHAAADTLYARVPDFGGYMMKMGSEKQNGDPRPPMVNRIADNLEPYGGMCLVRGFVYGNSRYTPEPYRHLIPHDIFVPEDGNYRENVILVPKGSAGDWDLSAPIPGIDGAMQKTGMGSELVIDKDFPSSWVEKWKWWLEQDTYRNGPGSLNKYSVQCIMGVAMISPSPAWTSSPLNMVNYYGLGRLAWNPDLSLNQIYSDWIKQTFGSDPEVLKTIRNILLISDDVARKLYMYRGYRGIWIDRGDELMVENKTPYSIGPEGIGPLSPELQLRLLNQYSPGLKEIYGDPLRGEEFLSAFHFRPYDYSLSIGRTLIQDIYGNMEEAVELAMVMAELWRSLIGKIDKQQYSLTQEVLDDFIRETEETRDKMGLSFEEHTGQKRKDVLEALAPESLAITGTYNVGHFGAVANGDIDNAPSINRAIDAASSAGGGIVFLPSGIYDSGPIELKNNVTLVLDAGVVLKAIPGVFDSGEALLIRGENLENVKIYGPGTIDGSNLPKGKTIALRLCNTIDIRNLNIFEAGQYALFLTNCTDLLIDNVNIKTSGDGLNMSQCNNLVISNSHIEAVRYRDGYPDGGENAIRFEDNLTSKVSTTSKNIIIRNSYLVNGSNGSQGVKDYIAKLGDASIENSRIICVGKK